MIPGQKDAATQRMDSLGTVSSGMEGLQEFGRGIDLGGQSLGLWIPPSLSQPLKRKRGALETPRSVKTACKHGVRHPFSVQMKLQALRERCLQVSIPSKTAQGRGKWVTDKPKTNFWMPWAPNGMLESQLSRVPRGPQPRCTRHQPAEILDGFRGALVKPRSKIRKKGEAGPQTPVEVSARSPQGPGEGAEREVAQPLHRAAQTGVQTADTNRP